MMRDTPSTFLDCAAIFKSGNTQSGVYTLTLPNTTTEVKVQLAWLSPQMHKLISIKILENTVKLPG